MPPSTMSAEPAKSSQIHPLVAIVGPTGSGKSEGALCLNQSWPVEVVSCDSLQVYRYLDVGTAKLLPEERQGVPHHLMDLLNPDEVFNAGDYARRTRPILRSIASAGRLPVVVGGTGFYLKALIEGLFPGPGRDETLRADLAAREARSPGVLRRFLHCADPAAAGRIHANDTNKLLRAVEVCILTRNSLTNLHGTGKDSLAGFRCLKIVLDPPRDALYERLDRRAGLMFSGGLVEEVRSILANGYRASAKPFESLGYRQALQVIHGEIDQDEAVESTRRDTRRYAKRQWTWFRREHDAIWVSGFGDQPETQARMLAVVKDFMASFSDFLD
jgi:tRNA dimethylallyltransferase